MDHGIKPHGWGVGCEASEPGLIPEASPRIAKYACELTFVRGVDTQKCQAVSQHLSGGVIQRQPGVVHGLDGIIPLRGDLAESYQR